MCSNLISDTFSLIIAGAKLPLFTMMPKRPSLIKEERFLAFCLVWEVARCRVNGFPEMFCIRQVFSDSSDFLACFDSGCIPLPIPSLNKAAHSFPWHSFITLHWRMFSNLVTGLLQHPVIQPQPQQIFFFFFWGGNPVICYSSNTRTPLVSKS